MGERGYGAPVSIDIGAACISARPGICVVSEAARLCWSRYSCLVNRWLLLSMFATVGCTTSSDDVDLAAAQRDCEVYAENCVGCHGVGGLGDGPHGTHLEPPPTNLLAAGELHPSEAEWMAAVRDGRPANGMPAFSDILDEMGMQSTRDHVLRLHEGTAPTCSGAPGTTSLTETSGPGGSTGEAGTETIGEPSTGSTTTATSGADTGSTGGDPSTTGSDASSSSSGSDDVSQECLDWCGCLEPACSAVAGYPFESSDACHADCATRTADEISCWQGFCESVADNPALADHNCAHAWGELGLAEC